MNTRILVTYASQAGSTRGIAEAIAKTLAEKGLLVDAIAMKDVKSLEAYSTVVAGSAIRGSKWLGEANQFLNRFQRELPRKTVYAFYVCMALTMESMKDEDHSSLLAPIRRVTAIAGECGFAGAVDLDRLPLIPDRLIIKGIVASGMWQAGDHRDWPAVQAWADFIAARCSTPDERLLSSALIHGHTAIQPS